MSWLRCASTALGLALAVASPAGAAQADGKPQESPALLIHGNWCGLGDANRSAPVDALDAACRAHDLCYERLGRNTCSCDRAFLKATARLIANPRADETLRSVAATANSLFSATPCVESGKSQRSATRR